MKAGDLMRFSISAHEEIVGFDVAMQKADRKSQKSLPGHINMHSHYKENF